MTERPSGPGSPGPIPPTTFFQADTTTFKELVQRLTGPHDDPHPHHHPTPSVPKLQPRHPAFKLHERRFGPSRLKLTILKPGPASPVLSCPRSPAQPPSSPPMSPDLANLSVCETEDAPGSFLAELNKEEEERAIKERRFYLHPSPRSGPRIAEPELLPLFPVASPGPREP